MSRENDIEGIIDLTFTVDDEKFGERRTIELKPGGEDEVVTNENKHEYVEYVDRLISRMKLMSVGWLRNGRS